MDFKIPSFLVVVGSSQSALPISSRSTDTLTTQEFGLFDSTTFKSVTAPSFPTNQSIFIAQGSGRSEIGSFKSAKIFPKNITGWRGVKAICTATQQITYVGFNGVDDCYTMSAGCDEEYTVTLRVFGERVRHLNPMGLTKSYLLKTACCDDCTTNCTDVNCDLLANSLVSQINADPYMSKWVVAEKVEKCTTPASAQTYSLLVPCDALNVATGTVTKSGSTIGSVAVGVGGSGYLTTPTVVAKNDGTPGNAVVTATMVGGVITGFTVVSAGTGYSGTATVTVQTPLEAFYSSLSGLLGTFAVTGDTDNCDSGTEEWIYTPDARDTELITSYPFGGISWTETPCIATAPSGCVCGVKITALALDAFGNPCVPTAFPYVFDAVRFKVYTNKGAETTNDFETFDPCTAWNVQTVQESSYQIGSGEYFKDLELESFGYYNKAKWHYSNPLFNYDHTLFVDTTKFYDMYELTYKVERNDAFSSLDENEATLTVLFEHNCSTNTLSTIGGLFQAAINTVANAQGFPSVSL